MQDFTAYLKKQFKQRWNRQVYTTLMHTNKAKTQCTIKVCIAVNNPITLGGKTVRSRQVQNISRMVASMCDLRASVKDFTVANWERVEVAEDAKS